jgi:hypothetical protein
MIPIDKLKAVKIILVHANCPDGIASAMILHHALPDAEVRFVQYGDEQAGVEPEPGMLWCDITPVAERAQEFIDAGAIVLDHHEGKDGAQRQVTERFVEVGLGVYSDDHSGAELAFKHVWMQLSDMAGSREPGWTVHVFAHLAAIRDLWQTDHEHWQQACYQAAALMFWSTDTLLSLLPRQWGQILPQVGQAAFEQRQRIVRAAVDNAFRFTTRKGTRVVVLQGYTLSSDAAQMIGDEADLVVGYSQRASECAGEGIVGYSCRSHTGYDCAALAARHGGGGHKPAAGFQDEFIVHMVGYPDDEENPVGRLRRLIEGHEEQV